MPKSTIINYDDEHKQMVMDYLNTFESEHGKRVLAHLKKLAGYNTVRKPPKDSTGKLDALMMVYNEAQRAVIVYIEAMLAKDLNEKRGMKHE